MVTSPSQTGFVEDASELSLAGRIPGIGETSPMSGATDFPEECAGVSCSHLRAEGLTALVAGFVRDTPRRPVNHEIAKPVSQRPDFVARRVVSRMCACACLLFERWPAAATWANSPSIHQPSATVGTGSPSHHPSPAASKPYFTLQKVAPQKCTLSVSIALCWLFRPTLRFAIATASRRGRLSIPALPHRSRSASPCRSGRWDHPSSTALCGILIPKNRARFPRRLPISRDLLGIG
jgi:hypothetical protein